MTMVVAIWCRHKGDNVIGCGINIPWCVPSDTKRFLDVVQGENVVCGRKTYESFPECTLEGCRLLVLSKNSEYEVADKAHHVLIHSQKDILRYIGEEDNLYVAGGAEIYQMFMSGKESLKPHVIVDCIYEGDTKKETDGEWVDITPSIEIMERKYRKITPDYVKDNVRCSLWLRKGEFVEQSVLKKLLLILQDSTENM